MNTSFIAAVVVWYNPSKDNVNNIKSYIDCVDKLYVVDNSPENNLELIHELSNYSNVEYIELGDNKGIAYALNQGATNAYNEGYQWLLTMDQDSCLTANTIHLMLEALSETESPDQVGILAAIPSCSEQVQKLPDTSFSIVDTAFTSGNMVRLEAWKKSGGWNDELFIDSVDYDFDFKVQLAGYNIVRCNGVVFLHQLGDISEFKFFGKQIFISTNHNYIRRYYITRNRLYMKSLYSKSFPLFVSSERYANLKDFIKILFSEKDKLRKFKSIYRGYKDYKRGRMGKYQW